MFPFSCPEIGPQSSELPIFQDESIDCFVVTAKKCLVQAAFATSLTETKICSSVVCRDVVKHPNHVIVALSALCPGPTCSFINDMAALHLINEKQPTTHAQHCDIQHFAMEEWCEKKEIVIEHFSGIVNLSDDLGGAWLSCLSDCGPFSN